MFLASILAAAAMAATPETTTTPAPATAAPPAATAAAAPAQPAMHKVCYQYEVSGTSVPKKKCVMEPVKDAKADAPAKKDAPKVE
ncbi:MAG: hypothetical protein JF588_08030 [Caulobacterales bacterium]|nr:hypothetical protein [Caulobacterales bacterium]